MEGRIKNFHLGLLVVIYYILRWSYLDFVSVFYSYKGQQVTFDIIKSVEGFIVLALVLLTFRYKRMSSFSYSVMSILIVLSFLPTVILYQNETDIRGILYSSTLLTVSPLLFDRGNISFKFNRFSNNANKYLLLGLLVLLVIPLVVTYGLNVSSKVFLLQDIYEVREEASEMSNMVAAYFYPLITKVVIPFSILYGIFSRTKILIILPTVILLYLYGVNPHKSVLFSLLVIFGLNIKKSYFGKTSLWLVVVLFVLLLGRYLTELHDVVMLESLFSRRTFFVKSILNIGYFQVFQDNHQYLSHSFLSVFFDNTLSLNPANYVGAEFYGTSRIHANNGIISTGYMNFGYFGVIGNIIVFSWVIGYMRSSNYPNLFFGLVFLFVMVFLSSGLFTILLTHGLALFLLLASLTIKNRKV